MLLGVGRPVYEDDQAVIAGVNEPVVNSRLDELAERLPEREDVQEDDGCVCESGYDEVGRRGVVRRLADVSSECRAESMLLPQEPTYA